MQIFSAVRADFIGLTMLMVLNGTNRTCFNISIRDDTQPEVVEKFRVHLLTLNSAGQTVYHTFATVTIIDNEGGCGFNINNSGLIVI